MYILGIVLIAVGCSLSSIGLNILALQEVSQKNNADFTKICALSLQLLGSVISLSALNFGPMSLLAPFNTLPVLLNLIIVYAFKTFYLKETTRLSLVDVSFSIVLFLVSFTCALSHLNSSLPTIPMLPEELVIIIGDTRYVLYQLAVIFPIVAGVIFTPSSIFACAVLQGISSSVVSLTYKVAITLVLETPIFMLYVIICFFAVVIQVYMMLLAVKLYKRTEDSHVHTLTVIIANVLFNITTGGVIFNECNTFSVLQWTQLILSAFYCVSVLLCYLVYKVY